MATARRHVGAAQGCQLRLWKAQSLLQLAQAPLLHLDQASLQQLVEASLQQLV